MAAPQINPLPPAPETSDSGEVFESKAFVFVGALEPFRQQANVQADYMEARAQDALRYSGNASNAAIRSGQSASAASGSADRAESARDAALATGKTYATTSAGLAATADGDYFTVAGPTSYLTLYRNDSGSESLITTYPSRKTIEAMEAGIAERFRQQPDPLLTSFIL